jgi:hypothetical protein
VYEWDLSQLSVPELQSLALADAKRSDSGKLRWQTLPQLAALAHPGNAQIPGLYGVLEIVEDVEHAARVFDRAFQKWARNPTEIESRVQGFVVVKNGRLSHTERDRLTKFAAIWSETLPWTMWRIWDRQDLLDHARESPSLLRPFFEKLAPSDYLSVAPALFPRDAARAARALAMSSATELTTKQWVRTGDAGYNDSSKLRLADLAIDLPCEIDRVRHAGVVGALIQRAEDPPDPRRRVVAGEVVVGGPGQGKSTVAQLVAHAYRIKLLQGLDSSVVHDKAREVMDSLAARFERAGVALPVRRRWPILIDLSQFGPKAEQTGSLLAHIADGIDVDGVPLDPQLLLRWLRHWPVILILDGLDEVPDRKARTAVIERIATFISTCNANGVDLRVIATTRPQGYQNEIDDLLMSTRVTLVELTETEALAYSDEVNLLRNANDPELADQVTERLVEAVHQRLTQRLMTTPLQVTIMTALAERAVDLPTTRYELFDSYYQTVYDRELAKGKPFAKLRTHRSHIDHLHERAGLELQKQTESGEHSHALLPRPEVSRLLVKRLVGAGFEEGEAKSISEEVLTLSVQRLVMLVSPRPTRYGFEVRSLQEYMAARALSEGEDEAVLRAIETLLPSAHWRNTWLLLVGRVLASRERLRPRILAIIEEANNRDPSGLLLTGSLAARELYLDQIAAEFPADRQTLLAMTLALFADYGERLPDALAAVVEAGVIEDSRSQAITLETIGAMSERSSANLATLLLTSLRRDRSPLGRYAHRNVPVGRKWERGTHKDMRELNFILSERLSASPNEVSVAELANLLSAGVPGVGNGAAASAELAAAVAPPAARSALLNVARELRVSMPAVAQHAIGILRNSVESEAQRTNLGRALRPTGEG